MRSGAFALLVLALLAPPAAAQEDERAGEVTPYRELVAQALEEFDARRWAEARALFRRAHAVEPNARTLRGIGMTSFELREYAAALRAFESSLAEERRPLTDAQRAHVVDLMERASAFVGRYALEVNVEHVELRVDGEPSPVDEPLVLDLGSHRVVATAPGHEPWERAVRVVGGERETLDVQLVARPASTSAAPEPAPPPRTRDDTLAHALLVAGAVGAVASAAPIAYWVDREVAVGQCDVDPCLNVGTLRDQRDLGAALSAVTLGLAVGVAVTGLVLLLVDQDPVARF